MYVPSQYDLKEPAALMIFQDGFACVDELGDFRVPIVYDNLIYKKKLPVTICLFVNQDIIQENILNLDGNLIIDAWNMMF